MTMAMMTAANATKRKPTVYTFGPEARDACWSALTSSFQQFDRRLENILNPVQVLCDSSQYDSQCNDVVTFRKDFGSSGAAYGSQEISLPGHSKNPSGAMTANNDATDSAPPFDRRLSGRHSRRHRRGQSLSVERRPAEKDFATKHNMPVIMESRRPQLAECWPVDGPSADSGSHPNNNNNDDDDHHHHKNEDDHNNNFDEISAEPVVGGECCADKVDKPLQVPSTPTNRTGTSWTPDYSSPSQSGTPLSSERSLLLSECVSPSSECVSPSSECVSPFTINELTLVAGDELVIVSDDGNGCAVKQPSIEYEMRIKEIDGNIVWYSKLFLGIMLFLLFRVLF